MKGLGPTNRRYGVQIIRTQGYIVEILMCPIVRTIVKLFTHKKKSSLKLNVKSKGKIIKATRLGTIRYSPTQVTTPSKVQNLGNMSLGRGFSVYPTAQSPVLHWVPALPLTGPFSLSSQVNKQSLCTCFWTTYSGSRSQRQSTGRNLVHRVKRLN